MIPHAKGAILDPTSDPVEFTVTKMGIDATRKWPEEGFTRAWPKVITMDEATQRAVDAKWSRLGL